MVLHIILLVVLGIILVILVNLQWKLRDMRLSPIGCASTGGGGAVVIVDTEQSQLSKILIESATWHGRNALNQKNPFVALREADQGIHQLESLMSLGWTNDRLVHTTNVNVDKLLGVMKATRKQIIQHIHGEFPDLQVSAASNENLEELGGIDQ